MRLERSAVILLISLYCLAHFAVRFTTSPNLTIEEAQFILMAQTLQGGYGLDEPPLIAWLFASLDAWPGLSLPVIVGAKYILLMAGLSCFYLAARNVLQRRDMSAAAVASWALTFLVGWEFHEDKLGAVALFAAVSMSLHAATRILTWRRPRDWIYFGALVGLGALASHVYLVFPIVIVAATLLTPFFRGALTVWRLIGAATIACLVYLPYALWLSSHPDVVSGMTGDILDRLVSAPELIDSLRNAAISYGEKSIEFVLPFTVFWLILFWSLWLPILYPIFARRSTDEEPHDAAWRRLFLRLTVAGMVVMATGVALSENGLRLFWFIPALIGWPIWLFTHVRRAGEFGIATRAFASIAIVFILLVLGLRYVDWRTQVEICPEDGCRAYAPIEAWAEGLKDAGFSMGTIVGADRHLTGNLLAEIPKARVLDAHYPQHIFPEASTRGACVAVWREVTGEGLASRTDGRNPADMPAALADYLRDDLGVSLTTLAPEGAIRRPLLQSSRRASTLYFAFAPPSEACR